MFQWFQNYFYFLSCHERLVTSNVFKFMENKWKKLKNVDYLKNYEINRKKDTNKIIKFNFKCAHLYKKSFLYMGWSQLVPGLPCRTSNVHIRHKHCFCHPLLLKRPTCPNHCKCSRTPVLILNSSFLTLSILVTQHILDRELISTSSSFCLSSFFILKLFTRYLTFVIIKYSHNSLHTQTYTPDIAYLPHCTNNFLSLFYIPSPNPMR